jgi:hypothetical protein
MVAGRFLFCALMLRGASCEWCFLFVKSVLQPQEGLFYQLVRRQGREHCQAKVDRKYRPGRSRGVIKKRHLPQIERVAESSKECNRFPIQESSN